MEARLSGNDVSGNDVSGNDVRAEMTSAEMTTDPGSEVKNHFILTFDGFTAAILDFTYKSFYRFMRHSTLHMSISSSWASWA